jgi:hypothetical protein
LTILRGQIANNGIGFPQHNVGFVIAQQWHQTVGIHCQKFGFAVQAKRAARENVFVRQFQLFKYPAHFFDVG